MTRSAVQSCIDVALWLSKQATVAEVHLQAERLQRLLFLAQMIYAERYHGAKLMPTNFVLHRGQIVEVNVLRVFESGHPLLGSARIPASLLPFLEEIWQYHNHTVLERIDRALRKNAAYRRAIAEPDGHEISFADLREIARAEVKTPHVEEQMRKSHPLRNSTEKLPDGRVVRSWAPRVVPRASVYKIETVRRKKKK